MRNIFFVIIIFASFLSVGQPHVKVAQKLSSGAGVRSSGNLLIVNWEAGSNSNGIVELDMSKDSPLFRSLQIEREGEIKTIGSLLDPEFILTIGERNLERNGWVVFFDKVHERKYFSHHMKLDKQSIEVSSEGSRTILKISSVSFSEYEGYLEITLFNGSPFMNIAAVVETHEDGRAIIYDGGLVSAKNQWKSVGWIETDGQFRNSGTLDQGSKNLEVKYRTIAGSHESGAIAVFPPPHQYFYPLDEAFNLEFVWHGNYYRGFLEGYGIGIRHDPKGDDRFIPWFNSPPNTDQRLNFFVLLDDSGKRNALEEVKKFTRNDHYEKIPGYKTFSSHFHNEFIMKVVLADKPVPPNPEFVEVFKSLGVDVVHLGEFHYTAHPKGPDSLRLKELKTLFDQCRRLSDEDFLLLPGEEPNVHFGGHWMQIFPNPVYWIMDRPQDVPFVKTNPEYGKIYHVGSADEMLQLLELEEGLAWTAHPRIKSSIGYPDKYHSEEFFQSNRFLGAAWKPMPGDLSYDRLGPRVLDLFNDMNNWGPRKRVIAEADIFTVTQENEMWANMNTNYLMIDKLPDFSEGWSDVLNALSEGRFFSTTGEILIPEFKINGAGPGQTVKLKNDGSAEITFKLNWTFPLDYAEVISGDGQEIFRDRVNLEETTPFGEETYTKNLILKGRKWVRLEVWDAAINGAFTQALWIE